MNFTATWTAPVPVLCVGNLTAGGSGKTPLAISLAEALAELGHRPHFLIRGYGGSETGPLLVDTSNHDSGMVGDEALLLARIAPTWIGANRRQSADAAIKAGADCLVMDDGFQNPSIEKTRSVLAIDAGYGFGNGRVIPAGPLREPVLSGCERASAAIIIGEDDKDIASSLEPFPVFKAKLLPQDNNALAGRRVYAFAGIGRPEKFYNSLRQIGCDLAGTRDFGDHHRYRAEEISQIIEQARQSDAIPVTTEKDFVRLPEEVQTQIKVLQVKLKWEGPSAALEIVSDLFSDG